MHPSSLSSKVKTL